MTLRQAADAAGMPPSALSRFLSGERGLRYETLRRLGDVLSMKPDELLAEVRHG